MGLRHPVAPAPDLNPMLASTYIGALEATYPPFIPAADSNFDAIVVLAGGIYHKGSLRPSDEASDASRQRTACGADLWHRSVAPKLLLTGGDATVLRTGPAESHEMKRWAVRLGVPESVIVVEEHCGRLTKMPSTPKRCWAQHVSCW